MSRRGLYTYRSPSGDVVEVVLDIDEIVTAMARRALWTQRGVARSNVLGTIRAQVVQRASDKLEVDA